MRGGGKWAKPACGRPLDGRVRRPPGDGADLPDRKKLIGEPRTQSMRPVFLVRASLATHQALSAGPRPAHADCLPLCCGILLLTFWSSLPSCSHVISNSSPSHRKRTVPSTSMLMYGNGSHVCSLLRNLLKRWRTIRRHLAAPDCPRQESIPHRTRAAARAGHRSDRGAIRPRSIQCR
jgi:hypothetical protein